MMNARKQKSKQKLRKCRRTRGPDDRKEYVDSNRRLTRVKKQEFKKKQGSKSGHQLEKCTCIFGENEKSWGREKK